MAKSGSKGRLERWRIPLTLGLAPVWVIGLLLMQPSGFGSAPYEFLKLLGFLLVFAAALGRVWCSLYIGGRKDRELCMQGPYSLTRNPLYFFSFLGAVGLCLAAQNVVLALLTACGFLFYYRVVIDREEARLARLFGEPFAAYRQRTPRFVPRLAVPDRPAALGVSVAVFERSLTEVSWFLVALVAVEAVETAKLSGLLLTWRTPF